MATTCPHPALVPAGLAAAAAGAVAEAVKRGYTRIAVRAVQATLQLGLLDFGREVTIAVVRQGRLGEAGKRGRPYHAWHTALPHCLCCRPVETVTFSRCAADGDSCLRAALQAACAPLQ